MADCRDHSSGGYDRSRDGKTYPKPAQRHRANCFPKSATSLALLTVPLLGSENIVTGEDGNIQIVRGQLSPVITASLASDFSREFNDYNEVRAVIESQTDRLVSSMN